MFSGKILSPFIQYRTIGRLHRERYGLGLMDKSGWSQDCVRYAHPSYVLVLVLQGRGEYITSTGQTFPLMPGSCFQRYPQLEHSTLIDPESNWHEIFLEFGASLTELLKNTGLIDYRHPVRTLPLPEFEARRFAELGDNFSNANELELTGLLPEFLYFAHWLLTAEISTASTPADNPEALLTAACALLSSRFTENVDLSAFCRQRHCSYEKFRKLFKANLGVSPHQYRILRRLDAARELLNRPELSIQAIANQLGYNSPYEFSAQFKRHFGEAPSHYRPRHRRPI